MNNLIFFFGDIPPGAPSHSVPVWTGSLTGCYLGLSLCWPPGNSAFFLSWLTSLWMVEKCFWHFGCRSDISHWTSLCGMNPSDVGQVNPSEAALSACLVYIPLHSDCLGKDFRLKVIFSWNWKIGLNCVSVSSSSIVHWEVQLLSGFLILDLWSVFLLFRTSGIPLFLGF